MADGTTVNSTSRTEPRKKAPPPPPPPPVRAPAEAAQQRNDHATAAAAVQASSGERAQRLLDTTQRKSAEPPLPGATTQNAGPDLQRPPRTPPTEPGPRPGPPATTPAPPPPSATPPPMAPPGTSSTPAPPAPSTPAPPAPRTQAPPPPPSAPPPPDRPTGPAAAPSNDPVGDRAARQQRIRAQVSERLYPGVRHLTPAQAQHVSGLVDRLTRNLGQGNQARGEVALERVLANNRLNVGLAGINGARGTARKPDELEQTRRDMSAAGGRPVDAVLDNAHGARNAHYSTPNPEQVRQLREILQDAAALELPVDVTAHSNGFNALAKVARENPTLALNHVTLINPNVPTEGRRQRDLAAIVHSSQGRVELVISRRDQYLPLSRAGVVTTDLIQKIVDDAARAGVRHITVIEKAKHELDDVARHRWSR